MLCGRPVSPRVWKREQHPVELSDIHGLANRDPHAHCIASSAITDGITECVTECVCELQSESPTQSVIVIVIITCPRHHNL